MRDAPYVSTTNACKLCTPLGAALAFKGIEGCVPFLHGSQGCATYMRRYVISHFREPVDIASSALGEKNAIYGGGANLKKGLLNVMQKYGASVIGVATTCLTETIGDDVPMILHEFRREFGDLELAEIVHCSTPSYSGTHMEGFHTAVRAIVDQLVTEKAPASHGVNLFPGFVSPADLRYLQAVCRDFGIDGTLIPDVSRTMDGPALADYEKLPSGGTPLAAIRAASGAAGSITCGACLPARLSGGQVLEDKWGVPNHAIGMPIGLRGTDALFDALENISGRAVPEEHALERGRLVDAMVDGHKYVFGKRAVVYGEEDLVAGLVAFLAEIGVRPVLAATGAKNPLFTETVRQSCAEVGIEPPLIKEGVDFFDIAEEAKALEPELLIGHSKGYRYARQWDVPLVRVGFPVHDRFGGQRIKHVGYAGAQELYDRIVNAVLEERQSASPVGYGYM